jgi:hypothetical protein
MSELTENPVIESGKLDKLVYKLPYEYTYEKTITGHQCTTFDGKIFQDVEEAQKYIEECLKDRVRLIKIIKEDILTHQELVKLYKDYKILTVKSPKDIKNLKCDAVVQYILFRENEYSYCTEEIGVFKSEYEMKEAIIDDLGINIWNTYFEKIEDKKYEIK